MGVSRNEKAARRESARFPAMVLVPVPDTNSSLAMLTVLDAERGPPTERFAVTVEDARDRNPPVRVARSEKDAVVPERLADDAMVMSLGISRSVSPVIVETVTFESVTPESMSMLLVCAMARKFESLLSTINVRKRLVSD